jgi:hypothetical protein
MFKVELKTENAAFDGDDLGPEVARLLRLTAELFEEGYRGAVLFDKNGNRVGYFETKDS